MKTVWKVLGLTALAASLTPYRVTTDEETGDVKLRALLWKGTYSHRAGNHGLTLDVGLFLPTEEEEPHLYADELVVHYHNGQPCCVSDEESCCCGGAMEDQEGAPKACCCQEQDAAAAPEAQADSASEAQADSAAEADCQAPDTQAGEDAPEKLREP